MSGSPRLLLFACIVAVRDLAIKLIKAHSHCAFFSGCNCDLFLLIMD